MTCGFDRTRRRGFTLIELLVVVAIIALLIAILLPSLAKARKQTKQTVCASNLHQISIALLTYQAEWKKFPHQARVNVVNASMPKGDGNCIGAWPVSVHQNLSKYMGKQSDVRPNEVFYCPTVKETDRGGDTDFIQPANSLGNPEAYLHITYTYFGRLNDGANDPALDVKAYGTVDKIPERNKHYVINEPSSQDVLITDSVMLWYGHSSWRICHGPWWDKPYTQREAPGVVEGQNVGYGDGHVEWRSKYEMPKELREPGNDFKALTISRTFRQDNDLWWW